MKIMSSGQAVRMGFSADKRKRRRQHRRAARTLLRTGGLFNSYSARGTTFSNVAAWHIYQARFL